VKDPNLQILCKSKRSTHHHHHRLSLSPATAFPSKKQPPTQKNHKQSSPPHVWRQSDSYQPIRDPKDHLRERGLCFLYDEGASGPGCGGEEERRRVEGRAEHEPVQSPPTPQSIRPQSYKPKPHHHHHRFSCVQKKTGKDKGGPEPNWEWGGEVEFDSGWWLLLLLLLLLLLWCGVLCNLEERERDIREKEGKGEIQEREKRHET